MTCLIPLTVRRHRGTPDTHRAHTQLCHTHIPKSLQRWVPCAASIALRSTTSDFPKPQGTKFPPSSASWRAQRSINSCLWAIMQCFPRGWEGFASCLTNSLLLLSRTLLSPLSSPEAPSPVPLSQLKHSEPTAPASLRPCSSCCPPCPRTNPPCPVPTSARALARTPREKMGMQEDRRITTTTCNQELPAGPKKKAPASPQYHPA